MNMQKMAKVSQTTTREIVSHLSKSLPRLSLLLFIILLHIPDYAELVVAVFSVTERPLLLAGA